MSNWEGELLCNIAQFLLFIICLSMSVHLFCICIAKPTDYSKYPFLSVGFLSVYMHISSEHPVASPLRCQQMPLSLNYVDFVYHLIIGAMSGILS